MKTAATTLPITMLAAAVASIMAAGQGCATRHASPRTTDGTPPVRRVAAEWEPALGVLVRWPAYLPHELLVELAHDASLHVMVEDDETAQDAQRWFDQWSIPRDRVAFHRIPGGDDAQWPRDYGPHPVLTEAGQLLLADARYDQSTPDSGLACDAPLLTPWNGGWGQQFLNYDVTLDDAAPSAIARSLGLDAMGLSVVLTGGNFLTDGRGGAVSTCILLNENRSNGMTDAAFLAEVHDLLGVDRYTIIPNFEDEGIQHIDCLLKLIDENRMLVARPPADHPLFDRYETLARDHLSAIRTASGRPFEILRIDTARYAEDRLAAYTNSLIVNDVVYVPLFDIPQDQIAMQQWRQALPGHTIKGFRYQFEEEPLVPDRARRIYPGGDGWRNFDALHCRTRAVWDPHMLFIGADAPTILPDGHVVTASIVPYSGQPLLSDELKLFWRQQGGEAWNVVPLSRRDDGRFQAAIPARDDPAIEYYLAAADLSGRRETSPRTAPHATHTLCVPVTDRASD